MPLPAAESGRLLARYAAERPRAARTLMRAIGRQSDGTAEAYRRIGPTPDHGVPLVALVLLESTHDG